MANSIALAKKYAAMLDEVYKLASLTAALDSDMTLTREGANANEIIVPKMVLQGLGSYSRNGGYVSGDQTLTWETIAFNYDRGRKFQIDTQDNEETQQVAFGALAGEFLRTKVIPEMDAFRFATYAGLAGGAPAGAALATGADVIAAIRVAVAAMDNAEVSVEGRILYITPTHLGLVEDLATTSSREVLNGFAQIIKVPQARFYTVVDLYDGTSVGEEAGGYVKDALGVNINFMVIHPSSLVQYTKNAVGKIIAPENNPDADAWIYAYRAYGLADVYDNKVDGVYVHKALA